MSVFRVEKNKNYTTMSNHHFKEREMSLKAKGLLSLMLSLPDDWDYTIKGLVSICKESETAIKNVLNELKEFGYLEIVKTQNAKGQFEYNYNIYENPEHKKPEVENPPMDNPVVDDPEVGNIVQLNTNKLNTKELSTKGLSTNDFIFDDTFSTAKKPGKQKPKFVPPSLEEIQAYCIERKNNINAKTFYDYYEAGNWTDGRGNKIKNWKQKVITWEKHTNTRSTQSNTSGNPFMDIAREEGII